MWMILRLGYVSTELFHLFRHESDAGFPHQLEHLFLELIYTRKNKLFTWNRKVWRIERRLCTCCNFFELLGTRGGSPSRSRTIRLPVYSTLVDRFGEMHPLLWHNMFVYTVCTTWYFHPQTQLQRTFGRLFCPDSICFDQPKGRRSASFVFA